MRSPYIVGPYIKAYPQLAMLLGSSDRALILQKLADLIEYFEQEGDPDSQHWIQRMEGKTWYRTTHARFHEKHFPWITLATCKRHIYALRNAGYLLMRGGWRAEGLYRREVWLTVDFDFLTIALSAIEAANMRSTSDQIDPIQGIKLIQSKGSNRSNPKDQIDPTYHNDVDVNHKDFKEGKPSFISSPTSEPTAQPMTNGSRTGDDADDKLLAIHNDGWVTKLKPDGTICFDQVTVDYLAAEHAAVMLALLAFSVKEKVAMDIAPRVTLHQVNLWVAYIKKRKNIARPSGYLVDMLGKNAYPPRSKEKSLLADVRGPQDLPPEGPEDGSRFITGQYADEIDH